MNDTFTWLTRELSKPVGIDKNDDLSVIQQYGNARAALSKAYGVNELKIKDEWEIAV